MKTQVISREEQVAVVKGMLLSNMLEHLGISLDEYLHQTTDGDRERHIYRCKRCSGLRQCVYMLCGEDIDPKSFCPNCEELMRLM